MSVYPKIKPLKIKNKIPCAGCGEFIIQSHNRRYCFVCSDKALNARQLKRKSSIMESKYRIDTIV